jgi:hypothetical protein
LYVGRHLAKSRLAWRRMVRVVRVKRKPVAPAGETSGIEVTGAIDLSFEERWRMLAPVEWASTTGRH